jgi:hypothetical protein
MGHDYTNDLKILYGNDIYYISKIYGRSNNRKIFVIRSKSFGKKIIRLARLIVECILGRRLKRYEEIHHIDFNPGNDNIWNLRLMTKRTHTRLHSIKMCVRLKKIKLKCVWCNSHFILSGSRKINSRLVSKNTKGHAGPFCSQSCICYFTHYKRKNPNNDFSNFYKNYDLKIKYFRKDGNIIKDERYNNAS